MSSAVDGLRLLEVHRATAFVFDQRGRMLHEAAPDRSSGKRFSFTGCAVGNLGVIRHDVPDAAAEQLERLLGAEPPFATPDAIPVNVDRYRTWLGPEASEPADFLLGLLWVFPRQLICGAGIHVVRSGTVAGDDLVDRFDDVVPVSLRDRGFRTAADLWEPWCVAVVDGQIVSVAATVRSSAEGAEVGLDTATGWTGQGLGAAATAGWSRHPELQGRELFYSTGRQNISSQKVTERLGLRFLGSTFAVP